MPRSEKPQPDEKPQVSAEDEAAAVAEGHGRNLSADPEDTTAADALVERQAPTSPHGEAAEAADPWVAARWAEHHEIDARLNAIPEQDRNPAAKRQAHPQQGITPA